MKKSLNTIADEIIDVINEKNIKAVSDAVWLELVHQKKLSSIDRLFELLEERQSKNKGSIRAIVSSAQKLADVQLKSLIAKIEDKYKSKVDIKEKVDPQLLGGLQVKIADEITDYSFEGKIKALRERIGVLHG